jgi:ABC-2 type transport system permease protein
MTDTMPAAPAVPVARPGPASWLRLVVTEAKLVGRDSAGLVVPLGLPLLILVMNGLGLEREPLDAYGGRTPMEVFVMPLVLMIVVATIGIVNMPSYLVSYRTAGVLRRLRATPAHPAMVLAAQVVVSAVQTAAGTTLALAVAAVAFDVRAPLHLGGAVLALGLGAAACYALGTVVAAVSPTPNTALAIGLVVFFATMALGGGFGPTENLPDLLADVGELLPFGATVAALGDAWAGAFPELRHLAALAVTTVGASVVAVLRFRWE